MEQLIRRLNTDYDRTLPESTWQRLFEGSRHIDLRHNDYLVRAGSVDTGVFFVREGIIRTVDMDGDRERTTRFSFPGTIITARYCFYADEPSVSHLQAVVPASVLRVPRRHLADMAARDHSLALWLLYYAWKEQYLEDNREATIHNGSVEERYLQTMRHRPWLVRDVPMATLASYLGCSPEHLCRIKARLLFK